MSQKSEIRKRVLQRRDALTADEIAAGSAAIFRRMRKIGEIRRAATLMVYLSFGSEVLTDDLIRWGWRRGKRIAVPLCRPETRELIPCRIDGFDELAPGHYGIREPKATFLKPVSREEIEAVIVPAVAFDRWGRRVGYGGGYYDRLLPRMPGAARIGAAFACQVLDELPSDAHDVTVDFIATELETVVPAVRP